MTRASSRKVGEQECGRRRRASAGAEQQSSRPPHMHQHSVGADARLPAVAVAAGRHVPRRLLYVCGSGGASRHAGSKVSTGATVVPAAAGDRPAEPVTAGALHPNSKASRNYLDIHLGHARQGRTHSPARKNTNRSHSVRSRKQPSWETSPAGGTPLDCVLKYESGATR